MTQTFFFFFLQLWQFVKSLGKSLEEDFCKCTKCASGVDRQAVFLPDAKWLDWELYKLGLPTDLDIWVVQTREKSNMLCLIADDQELITANFIIVEVKGYVW